MMIGKWACVFLALGLATGIPAFAADELEAMIKAGDHRKLEMYYREEAKNLKAKADRWEFVAEYYEQFPQEYSGDPATVQKHIDNVRAMAEDYLKASHEARDLARRHNSLIRRGP